MVFVAVGLDFGLAVYKRYMGEETNIGYAAHFGGALAGETLVLVHACLKCTEVANIHDF